MLFCGNEIIFQALHRGGELDLVELGDAVDELGHRLAEGVGDLVLGDRGVLGDVVQERRHQRLAVEMPAGEDLGDRERVGNVRVTRLARLPGVRGLGEAVGLLQARDVLRLQVAEAFGIAKYRGSRRHAAQFCTKYVITISYLVRNSGHKPGGVVGTALRFRTSVPTLPTAISRSAITVGLSRFGSTKGDAPALSWRAR